MVAFAATTVSFSASGDPSLTWPTHSIGAPLKNGKMDISSGNNLKLNAIQEPTLNFKIILLTLSNMILVVNARPNAWAPGQRTGALAPAWLIHCWPPFFFFLSFSLACLYRNSLREAPSSEGSLSINKYSPTTLLFMKSYCCSLVIAQFLQPFFVAYTALWNWIMSLFRPNKPNSTMLLPNKYCAIMIQYRATDTQWTRMDGLNRASVCLWASCDTGGSVVLTTLVKLLLKMSRKMGKKLKEPGKTLSEGVRGTAWYSLATRGLVLGGGVGGGVGRMVHCNSYSDD